MDGCEECGGVPEDDLLIDPDAQAQILPLLDDLIESLIIANTPSNIAPVANDDTATTALATPIIIPVLENDVDPDGSELFIIEVTQPPNGLVAISPDKQTITYDPTDPSFSGFDTFTYTIADSEIEEGSGTDTATVFITVLGSDGALPLDSTPPIITLLGDATVTLLVGETYTDDGATASDIVDGDLTSQIVTVNPVDTSITATYIVTYDVSDSTGNQASQITRTVEVIISAQAVQNIIDGLQTIIDENLGTPLEDKLQDVLDSLQTALDELNKTPPDNQPAMGNIEGAMGDLEAAINEGPVPVSGAELMDTLAGIARHLAVNAIVEAIATPGSDPGEISDAQQSLTDGDLLRTSGDFKDAVNKYKDVLAKAESALP